MASEQVTTKKNQTTPDKILETSFPIIGIGASAGGLEAYEQFFRHVPEKCDMAFVLIQHLDPSHASMLSDIVQRTTAMPVIEAQDQMKVLPNHVYVIPPNRDLAIFHGKLQLNVPSEPRGQRMPIDAFMRSLADDQGEASVGIILSGTGTDGTLGLRAILGAGGLTLVQTPESAKFDGMPTSAIQSGYAAHILPAQEMPKTILDQLHHVITKTDAPIQLAESGLNRILMLLRNSSGHDFGLYKKTTILRRIDRRMALHNIENADVYLRFLKENPAELQLLFKELLINVTNFFRDSELFDELKKNVLPQLLIDKPEDYVFRVWVPGCATGEEAYSIAIILRELMEESHQEFRTQIYATDLDDDAIATARAGLYLPNITQDVSPDRLRRFFIKDETGYRVRKEIREMIVFAVQNVIKDPPFTKLDLLSCRNLMIYLGPELQNRLIPAFHYALKSGGILVLSPSESIGHHAELFAAVNRKWKIYRATHTGASARKLITSGLAWASNPALKAAETTVKKARETNFVELSRRMLLQYFAPASVVTDMQGNILYVHGETGKYLRPAPGQATLNAIEMARDGLQLEIRSAINTITSSVEPFISKELTVKTNGQVSVVRFSVRRLTEPNAEDGMLLLCFQDVAAMPAVKTKRLPQVSETTAQLRIEALEQELAYTKETLQANLEAQQANNEELLSSNEEMQSTNEELQSTNEELETSKEELQSVNEELITVNAELQSNIEQLSDMQNDMKNLLDNVNVGVIFLDQEMQIRRFTREATRIYRLMPSDINRHLGDIKADIEGDDLLVAAQTVLDTLVPYEREICATNGIWYLARIQPYRSLDNVIDGVVLTFTDVTAHIKSLAMEEALELSESIVNTVREPLVVLNKKLQIVSVSQSFYQVFKVAPDEVLQHIIYDLGNRQWDIPALHALLDTLLSKGEAFENYLVLHDFPIIGHKQMLLNARRIESSRGDPQLILLAIEEVK